jgi:hypothetical protein
VVDVFRILGPQARAAIPEYWSVNLVARSVEVYTEPTGPCEAPKGHARLLASNSSPTRGISVEHFILPERCHMHGRHPSILRAQLFAPFSVLPTSDSRPTSCKA